MHSGLPYTQITEMTQVNVGVGALSIFPTLLLQNGGTLYNQQRSATNLLSLQSKEAFEYWTDFYNKYSFPMTYDFFNRFRVGLMPMAIQNYNVYAQLTAAAPEIDGYWSMYELPGVRKDDGSIDNRVTGGGTGAVLLNQSENKAEAWEFIKWWTSAETQYQYGTEIENILGEAARVPTSNVEALKRYSWDKDKLDSILKQWENVEELPEVPGGYYVSRVIDQAFWNTVNGNENSIDMLLKWSKIANTEIARKRYQYDIP
jgi:ABC-type glycerol-3-phosphate transport system substrate-binding protein